MACVVFGFDLLFLLQMIFFGDGQWFAGLSLIAGSASLAWMLFMNPKVLIYDEGITIVNPLITATIGWAEVDEIETRFALTVYSGDAKVVAWAAPAPGRYHARTIHRTEFKGIDYDKDFGVRPGDSPRTHSGAAAHLARTRLASHRKNGGVSAKRSGKFNTAIAAVVGISLILVAVSQLIRL